MKITKNIKTTLNYLLAHLSLLWNEFAPSINPSHHGEECLYNGEHDDFECCCDECDHYLFCFPDWAEYIE